MLKVDFFAAMKNIIAAVSDSETHFLLSSICKSGGLVDDHLSPMRNFRAYTLLRAKFRGAEEKLLTGFDLEFLDDPSFWQILSAGSSEEQIRSASEALTSLDKLIDVSPRLGKVFEIDDSLLKVFSKGGYDSTLVAFVIIETPEARLSPARVSSALRSIGMLCSVAAEIYEIQQQPELIYCDIGSDLQVILKAKESIIRFLRETLTPFLHRILLSKEIQAEKRIELAAKSVPVLLEIKDKKEALGIEKAQILERTVIEALSEFSSSGTILAELENTADSELRQIIVSPAKQISHVPTLGEPQDEAKT